MRDFTKGSIPTQLFRFALPIIAGDMLQALYLVIDAIWVGRLVGHRALAAISATFPVFFFFMAFTIGLSVATNILIGQSYGSKKKDILSEVLKNSFFIVLFISGIISILGIVFSTSILELLNTPKIIKSDANIYLVIILVGLVLKAVYSWFAGVLRGFGDSKTPLFIFALTVVLNLIITPLLIVGIGPFPRLGIAGSALGTVFSSFIGLFLGYILLIKKNYFLDLSQWRLKLDYLITKKIFSLALPVSFHIMIRSISWIAIIAMVNKFGTNLTAAYGIGSRIDMFVFLPVLSICIATSSMTSQNIGAKQFKRVSKILIYAILFSFSYSLILFMLVNIFPYQIAKIFTDNPTVINSTVQYLRIISLTYFLFSFLLSFQGIITGVGDTHYLMGVTVISMLLVRIPLAYFLGGHTQFKEIGIWIAIVCSVAVALILNLAYYLSGLWKRRIVVQDLSFNQ